MGLLDWEKASESDNFDGFIYALSKLGSHHKDINIVAELYKSKKFYVEMEG